MGKLQTLLHAGKALGTRQGILRLQYELQRGSGLMSRKMRSVDGWNSWSLKKIAPGMSAQAIRAARLDGTRPFFFNGVRAIAPDLRHVLGPDAENGTRSQADKILAGHLPFFGDLSFDCEFPPQWFRNPATGQSVSPNQSWTGMRFASPAYGDLKFILEPSRFLFVYPLVRAYALTGDEKYPQAFWRSIEDWALHNPPMSGPLWICGQESSLRILAWSFAMHGFIASSSTTDERVALLVSMIAAHAWRIAQTISYARSQRSNHLISEAVGLWTAGILYPELTEAKEWNALGADLLHEAIVDQINPQGVSHQHSFNYQRMILQLLLWSLRLSEIDSTPLHHDIRTRAESAFDFIRTWVDPESGCAPNYGSDDGSLILPLTAHSYRDYRPLLQLGAAVLNREPINTGSWEEALLWLGLKTQIQKAPDTNSAPTADTGYFRLGDSTSWAMIRAGQYTHRPYQADQLHVDLWWQGINLARDPGTYLYNGPAPWNNGLAKTCVHNTVTVDRRDQMRRAGRFLWLDWAQASGKISTSQKNSASKCSPDFFQGQHDGYRGLGIVHRRSVQWLPGCGWAITDDLDRAKKNINAKIESVKNVSVNNIHEEHDFNLHWLVPDLPFQVFHRPFRVILDTKLGPVRWMIASNASAAASARSVIRAGEKVWPAAGDNANRNVYGEEDLLGWEAPTYGKLCPAISILCRAQSPLPVRFVTILLTNDQAAATSQGNEISVAWNDKKVLLSLTPSSNKQTL